MFQWVRSTQSGGGHSAWHLLHSIRKGPRTWRVPAPTNPYARQSGVRAFALTACGFDFDDFQIQPTAATPTNARRPTLGPAGRGSICNGCHNLATILATTPEA